MANNFTLSVGQAHELEMAMNRVGGWDGALVKALSTGARLGEVRDVLTGVATIVKHCLTLALDKAFNPSELIGKNWKVWKGPANGKGLGGDEDYVSEPDIVDFEQIALETNLQDGEASVHGEEKMRRVRAGKNRQLGGRAFLALWNDWQSCKDAGKPEDSILEKLRKSKKIGNSIYFFGLTLRSPYGDRGVLYLSFSGGEWDWGYCWLEEWHNYLWGAGSPSVVLASPVRNEISNGASVKIQS